MANITSAARWDMRTLEMSARSIAWIVMMPHNERWISGLKVLGTAGCICGPMHCIGPPAVVPGLQFCARLPPQLCFVDAEYLGQPIADQILTECRVIMLAMIG